MGMLLLLACSDYAFQDGPKDPRDGRPPRDTGPDTDTTDVVDSGSGPDDGTVPNGDPCEATHTVRIGLSADDWWEGWLAGTHFGEVEHWWEAGWTEMELECGDYVLAVYATDMHEAISGFIGQVEVDGVVTSQTGDGTWRAYDGNPGGNEWKHADYDDSAWGTGVDCDYATATGWWGSSPADLTGAGAWWIWPHDCLALGDAAFRVTFSVP